MGTFLQWWGAVRSGCRADCRTNCQWPQLAGSTRLSRDGGISADETLLSVSRAAQIARLIRPTAMRLPLTLERLQFVESEHGMFRLIPRVLQIGLATEQEHPVHRCGVGGQLEPMVRVGDMPLLGVTAPRRQLRSRRGWPPNTPR